MILRVWVADWVLEEPPPQVVSVGDEFVGSLAFEESGRRGRSAELTQRITAIAEPLPLWSGGGAYPVRLEVDGAAIYWDAPEATSGRVVVSGRIEWNTVDAPDGFPCTTGVIRRVRMEWIEIAQHQLGVWRRTSRPELYEDVQSSYLPQNELIAEMLSASDNVEAELPPAATTGHIFLRYPSPSRQPIGAVRRTWTGVLLDVEVTGVDAR